MAVSTCVNDNSFGPSVQGCRGDFDFTLRFQRIFFAIIPAAVFIALTLPRIAWLAVKPRIVSGTLQQFTKLISIAVSATLQLALLILSATSNDPGFDAFAIAASTLGFLAMLFMAGLSFAEHSRAPRPSALLVCYLLLQILLDVAQARTHWLIAQSPSATRFASLFTTALAVKVVILVLESQRKARWLSWNVDEHSPEEMSGIFSLGVYFWLSNLFLRGYHSILSTDDLYALDRGMDSETLQGKLAANLEKSPHHDKRFSLAKALAKTLAVPLLLPVAPRVAMIGFTYSQPFFIRSLLTYLEDTDASKNTGYGLIGAAVLIYTGIAIADALYWYFHQRALYMARGCLVALIYKKTTETKITDIGDAAALTLMSTDIERILQGFHGLHEFWANMIEVAVGCWLLQRELGTAFISPVVVIVLCVAVTLVIAGLSGKRQSRWMSRIQTRVGLTANVISNIKYLRISGITAPVSEFIQKMRVDELNVGNQFRWLLIATATAAYIPNAISPVVAFGFTNKQLDTTRIFTSFSYISLITNPLGQLFQSVPPTVAGFVCLGRIQEFLEAAPHVDFRKPSPPTSGHDTAKLDEKIPTDMESSQRRPLAAAEPRISILDGSFGWAPDKTILKHITVTIPASQLTLVVGPVASGKSTFCKALLGELPVSSGEVIFPLGQAVIGYCEQTPFLSNGSIKDNIIGHSVFNQPKYDEVINACILKTDLAILPQGDATNIGSNGIMLSGGQKQRLSLARALYLEADFLVIDDILSGLDNDTASEVFQRVFGPEGLIRRRNATALLCTHAVRYLPLADHIIALGADGTLIEEGTFADLSRDDKYVASLGVSSTQDTRDFESQASTLEEPTPAAPPRAARVASISAELQAQSRATGDTKVYAHYLGSISGWATATCLASGLLFGVGRNIPTLWMTYWAEDSFDRSGQFYIGIFGMLRGLQVLALFACCMSVVIWMTTQSGALLHQQALQTVINASLRFFTTTDSGVVTNLFSQDMTLIDGELPMSLLNVVTQGFDAIMMAIVVGIGSPYLAISYPAIILVLYILQRFYLRTSRQLRLLDLEAKSPLYAHFLDTIKGLATIRALGWTDQYIGYSQDLLNTSQRPAYLLAMIQQWLALSLQLVVMVISVMVVTLATQLRTNSGFAGASLVTLMTWGETISTLIRYYTQVETSIGAVSRIKTFSEKVKSENLDGEDMELPEEWPDQGSIKIMGVSASYGSDVETTSLDDNSTVQTPGTLALNGLDISIEPAQKVALCGRTGSGKSSVILLLLRLLDPLPSCSQNIEIDGLPFHRIDRSTVRRRIIAVPQDAVFLPDKSSIKDNLDPFNAASDLECLAVLQTVQLTSFVHERGTVHAGMNAEDLSAGQKQLFSLGRAVLRRRAKHRLGGNRGGGIFLLDELSSSVDRETERVMQEIIKEEFAEFTIVMVSHRLEMVMDFFDAVVVMDQGRVVETGSPRELAATEGSRFSELWVIEKQGWE
ncbi:ABC transporter [Ilyonectria sp. MPI-CAGE-AT-0026]|nr:ABC transporter [Ilyonectria sp. MPI-CAGE-AT-0026]